MKDIRISYAGNWRKLHWKSLESAYRSSPYFEYYEEVLRKLYFGKEQVFLADLNRSGLEMIMGLLKLEKELEYSLEYLSPDASSDLRNEDFMDTGRGSDTMSYIQVFKTSGDFQPNLSIVDLICNEGPNAINLLI